MDTLLKKSPKGAVLFSFGTFADPSLMPTQMVDIFLEAFSHFPEYTFIWKFKRGVNDTKFDLYPNVYTTQWLDQTSLIGKNLLAQSLASGTIPAFSRPSSEGLHHAQWAQQHHGSCVSRYAGHLYELTVSNCFQENQWSVHHSSRISTAT